VYAQIYAERMSNTSTGKTMRVWSTAERLRFEVIEASQTLRIKANCSEGHSSGDRGGTYDPVDRQFFLDLDKSEVEKLVAHALNEQLLKKMNIANLAQIDRVSKLEDDLSETKAQLKAAQAKIADLESRITQARKALGEP
jgi:chromosome segregation ATPase